MVADHRGRYDRGLPFHRWTWYFVVRSLAEKVQYAGMTVTEEPGGARRSHMEPENCILGAAGGTDGDADEIRAKLPTEYFQLRP